MSSWIGNSLKQSIFQQDPKPEWIKINGVVCGESSQFGYQTVFNKNVGQLLDSLASDSTVVCVNYNWNSGVAYVKKGVNVANDSDSVAKMGYTCFLLKGRLPIYPGFITWDGFKFILNNQKWVPVGCNCYILGLTESYQYPTNQQIIEIFQTVQKMKGTVVRAHTLGVSTGNSMSLLNGINTWNSSAWQPIEFAFKTAADYGIKLIVPMTDAYNFYHGSLGNFTSWRGLDRSQFWTDQNVRNDFKNFIKTWLNHVNSLTGVAIKDDPTLFAIELGNELGNIRPSVQSTTIPTQEWISDITNYIKSIDTKHFVLNGSDECLGSQTSNDFQISTIDAYSQHFYWLDWARLDSGIAQAKQVGKPLIIGEYSSGFGVDWFKGIESRSVAGTLFWGLYPSTIQHYDGYTIYPFSLSQLLPLSNHFRRMQNLPEVTSL